MMSVPRVVTLVNSFASTLRLNVIACIPDRASNPTPKTTPAIIPSMRENPRSSTMNDPLFLLCPNLVNIYVQVEAAHHFIFPRGVI
jgi:hypothetical protein